MSDFSLSSALTIAVAGLLIWAGISILIGLKRINETFELVPNRFIYPSNFKPEKCKDPAGFIGFITPRLRAFALLSLLLSVLLILQSVTKVFAFLPDWLAKRASSLLFIPLFIWYVFVINKAAKQYW